RSEDSWLDLNSQHVRRSPLYLSRRFHRPRTRPRLGELQMNPFRPTYLTRFDDEAASFYACGAVGILSVVLVQRNGAAMIEIGKENRNPERLPVLISRMADPLAIERASTENVSAHGMRVLTERAWKRDTHVIIQSSTNELWARGKVVYCQAFSDRTYAIGLELLARTGDWITRSSFVSPFG